MRLSRLWPRTRITHFIVLRSSMPTASGCSPTISMPLIEHAQRLRDPIRPLVEPQHAVARSRFVCCNAAVSSATPLATAQMQDVGHLDILLTFLNEAGRACSPTRCQSVPTAARPCRGRLWARRSGRCERVKSSRPEIAIASLSHAQRTMQTLETQLDRPAGKREGRRISMARCAAQSGRNGLNLRSDRPPVVQE